MLLDFEVVGSLARTISDLRMLHMQMAGPDPRDPASRTYPEQAVPDRVLRILHVPLLRGQPCDPYILEASIRCAQTFQSLGHHVETADMPIDLTALNQVWPRIGRTGLARMFDTLPLLVDKASSAYRKMAAEGHQITAPQLLEVLDIVRELRQQIVQVFAQFDVIMMPCAAARPWPAAVPFPDRIDGKPVGARGHAIYTGWINATGIPALAIPVGPPVEGIPVGIQLAADQGQETLLLRLGEAYESASLPLQRQTAETP